MSILRTLATDCQALFPAADKGQERFRWFLLTLQAILVPITASRTSNLLRAIETLFGVRIAEWRYYTFMASVKLPWTQMWEVLWRSIPSPLCDGRLLLGLDDSINPKTGRKIFACQKALGAALPKRRRETLKQRLREAVAGKYGRQGLVLDMKLKGRKLSQHTQGGPVDEILYDHGCSDRALRGCPSAV
jgi:hypothetical protein